MQFIDILIKNGTILTMDSSNSRIENGLIGIKGDSISYIGTGPQNMFDARTIIDAKGGIILPGLINGHTHAAMTLYRGLADDLPLMEWLNNYIFPLEKKINADFVILDLGAGSHYNVLDFFLAADHGIVVVNPDPLSILESYNFIKLALFRQIAQTIRSHNGALTLIKEIARTETHRSQSTVHDLLREVQGMDVTLGEKMTAFLTEFRPMIMINMLAGTNDENNVLAIKRAAEELLAIDMEYIGAVQKDDTVRKSLDKMIPFISYDPKSPASRDLANIIIMKLLHSGRFKSLRNKHTLRRRVNEKGEEKRIEVICSVNCPYWEDCGFKNGGYPCELKFLSGIQGLRGE